MKYYRGYRLIQKGSMGEPITMQFKVDVEDQGERRPLEPRFDLRNHSPTGFEWGYGGSGPAQLALALVADCCGDAFAVPAIYQRVRRMVASFANDGWLATEASIFAAVQLAMQEANLTESDLKGGSDEEIEG